MKKKATILAAILVLAALLSACGGQCAILSNDDNTVSLMAENSGDSGGTGIISVAEGEQLHLEYDMKKGSFDLSIGDGATDIDLSLEEIQNELFNGGEIFSQSGLEGTGSLDIQAAPGEYTVAVMYHDATGEGTLSTVASEADTAEEAADTAEDGQNPVMNFVGKYGSGRAGMLVEAEGKDGAKITVTWASSAAENSTWTMHGTFDETTLTVAYSDCVKTDCVYGEDGKIQSETVAYENGTGKIIFREQEYALTWEDDQEHIADGMVFEG